MPAENDNTTEKEPSNNTPQNVLLFRYLHANDEDFLDEFPRLPPEANPLDDRFADPRVLAGEVQPNMGGFGFGGGGQEGQEGFWGLHGE
jgi:hypothetical protein